MTSTLPSPPVIKPRQRPVIKAKGAVPDPPPVQQNHLLEAPGQGQGFSLESLIQRPAVTSHAVLHPDKVAVITQTVPDRIKAVTGIAEMHSYRASEVSPETTTSAPRYSDHNEIYRKIHEREPIGLKELQLIQKNINRLDQEAHIEICRIVLSRMENKYTVNNYGTYVDLNDLDQETLWRIYHYVTFCLEDLERRQVRVDAEADMQRQLRENKVFQEMSRLAGNNSHASQNILYQSQPHYHPGHVPSYEELRQDALRLHQGGEASLPGETEDHRLGGNEETETANEAEFEMESAFYDAGHGQMADDFDMAGGASDSE